MNLRNAKCSSFIFYFSITVENYFMSETAQPQLVFCRFKSLCVVCDVKSLCIVLYVIENEDSKNAIRQAQICLRLPILCKLHA